MLCLYLGSAETFLGDMNADDFVDCVAWCGRNISEFTPDYEGTRFFLETCDSLFKYLKGKNAISDASAPGAAAALLLQGEKMNIVLPDGHFDDANSARAWDATPDIPAKIFLNIGERLQELLEVLHRFFEREYFRLDLDRAAFLYYGILMGYEDEKKANLEETSECFWDYFLFDYHLLRSDKRPLEFFMNVPACRKAMNMTQYLPNVTVMFWKNCVKQDWRYLKSTAIQMTALLNVQTG